MVIPIALLLFPRPVPDSSTLIAPPLVPVRRRRALPLADQVAKRLRDRIAEGEWSAGDRLPGERQLAEEMGVSRVSVRSALQSLKAQGFIAAVQGGGTRLVATAPEIETGLTELISQKADNLHDLADIRIALEVWAAGKAAERADTAALADIGNRLQAMIDAPRGVFDEGHTDATLAQLDVQFHLAIGEAAGSSVYLHILSVIRDTLLQMLRFHRYQLFIAPEDDAMVMRHHAAIFAAIAAADPGSARAEMERHLTWVLEQYNRI